MKLVNIAADATWTWSYLLLKQFTIKISKMKGRSQRTGIQMSWWCFH